MDSDELNLKDLINIPSSSSNETIRTDEILENINNNQGKLEKHCICIEDQGSKELYTPMQFASKNGLNDLVEGLLKFGANPNFSGEDTGYQFKNKRYSTNQNSNNKKDNTGEYDSCKKYPLLLAAEKGHHEVLKLFKYYNSDNESISCSHIIVDELKTEDKKLLDNDNKLNVAVNFNVICADKNETVLHIVLRQPLLEGKCLQESIRMMIASAKS